MKLIKRYKSTMYGNYWKGMLIYGLLVGFGLILVVLFRSWIKSPITSPVSYTENIVMLILMFIGVYLYKQNLTQKKISFKESYLVGLGSGIIGSILYGMFIFIYAQYLDSGLQERCFDIQRQAANNSHFSNEAIKAITKPSYIAFSAIFLSSVMSVLWAMIAGLLIRNEKGVVVNKEMKTKKIKKQENTNE